MELLTSSSTTMFAEKDQSGETIINVEISVSLGTAKTFREQFSAI